MREFIDDGVRNKWRMTLIGRGVPAYNIDEYMDIFLLNLEDKKTINEHFRNNRIRVRPITKKYGWISGLKRRNDKTIYLYTERGKNWVVSQRQQFMFMKNIFKRFPLTPDGTEIDGEKSTPIQSQDSVDCTSEEKRHVLMEYLRTLYSILDERKSGK